MHQVSNPFQACNDIFFKPNPVFATLLEKHNWSWLPFFIVILVGLLPAWLYFDFVDFNWYKEMLIQSQYADVSPSEQNVIRDSMTLSSVKMFTVFGVLFGTVVINAVFALYLNLITKIDPDNVQGFTDWYGFGWWVFMPTIVGSLIALVLLLMAGDHQVYPSSLVPTSLSYLLGLQIESPWYGLAQGIRLESFWTMYLTVVGITQWTKIPTQKATLIAVAPSLVIWTIWAMLILV